MADKARFAQLINDRLLVLDRPAAWLARKVGTQEINISRWRDDELPTMPRVPAVVHALAAALAMSEAQKGDFFSAAGLVYHPTASSPPAPAAPQLDPDQVAAYLAVMRSECGRAETRPYLNRLTDLHGAPAHLTLLAEGAQAGVYVPLRFDLHPSRSEQEMLGELAEHGKRAGKSTQRDLARGDIALAEVLASPGHVVFIGAAGCGKTTILRVVAATLAAGDTNLARKELGLTTASRPLPVFVALREFEYACTSEPKRYQRDLAGLLRFMDDHFARSHPRRFPRDFLSSLVQSGGAWLLLDALDEVADFDHRLTVRQIIEKLAGEFPTNRLLVTARVAAYTGGANTRLDERFQVATVRDLTRAQWAPIVTRLYQGLEPIPQIASDRSADLLRKIDGEPMLQNMVKTPLMVWAATIIHYTKNDLPEQRAELYRAYVDVLLGERLHEEQQDAKAAQYLRDYNWPMGDRLLYLSYAAYQAHLGAETKRGDHDRQAVVIVDEDDLVKHILAPYVIEHRMLGGEKRQVRRQIEEETRKFVTFMAERSGLLCQVPEGGGYSLGDHLTVQEFLAARYLVDNVRGTSEWREFLQTHAGQSWWLETYLLMAGCLLEKSEQARRFLLDELGKFPGEGNAHAYGLAWAGRALLEIPPRRVVWHDSARGELASRLVRVLWQNPPATTVAARVEAGDVLGRLGDPRFTGPCLLPEFIPIAGGMFWMGSDEAEVAQVKVETGNEWNDETPRHQVALSPYALAKYPTTNAMFGRFREANGYTDARWWHEAKAAKVWRPDGTVKDWFGDSRSQPGYWDNKDFSSPSQPVVGVTWYEAVAYCRWLTATLNDGHVYRLPTEAEWERAARGAEASRYPWSDEWVAGRCNAEKLGQERTTPVGIFPDGGSAEGVLDLAGNVWEWCSDWYDKETYKERAGRVTRDPAGPAAGQYRVLRGGSWGADRNRVRCAYRGRHFPARRYIISGFRVARSSLK